MDLQISSVQRQQLIEWASAEAPHECCGLLLGQDGRIETLQLTSNVARDPSREFEIDPLALIAGQKHARQGGPSILGYFHSHPNGLARPSAQDVRMAVADGRVWLIIAGNSISGWQPVNSAERSCVTFVSVRLVEG